MSRNPPVTRVKVEDVASLRVLVVDDNLNVQRLICDVLRAGGVRQVQTAADGLRARDRIANWDPQVIFCDWHMPVMDGLEFTRSIRRAAVQWDSRIPNPQVPVIIVTGRRSEADVQIARKAGVNEFVIKPFTPASLLSRLQLVLTKPRPFVVTPAYVGPDRRRKTEPLYLGPMRRRGDPSAPVVEADRVAARHAINGELEALRALVEVRGELDREILRTACRVMKKISSCAAQVRDARVQRAATLLIDYVDAMGGHERCEAEVLEVHFRAIGRLLELQQGEDEEAALVVAELESVVRIRLARRRAA